MARWFCPPSDCTGHGGGDTRINQFPFSNGPRAGVGAAVLDGGGVMGGGGLSRGDRDRPRGWSRSCGAGSRRGRQARTTRACTARGVAYPQAPRANVMEGNAPRVASAPRHGRGLRTADWERSEKGAA